MSERLDSPPVETGAGQGCLPMVARLFWMVGGNIALLACAGLMAQGADRGLVDGLYFAAAAAMIGVRYLDITRFQGQTSDGQPASLADFRRYAALMVVVAAGVYALARYVLPRYL